MNPENPFLSLFDTEVVQVCFTPENGMATISLRVPSPIYTRVLDMSEKSGLTKTDVCRLLLAKAIRDMDENRNHD